MFRIIVTAGLLLWSMAISAGDAGHPDVVAEVKETTAAWVAAFNARDAQRIAALYAPDAVFWGTVSPTIRITPDEVLEYFEASVARNPKMRIGVEDQHVRVYGEMATNSGIYVTHNPQPGAQDIVKVSRFTFVYQRQHDGWIIVSHHSSSMPSE
jgi:uncharacterized protein (TIGR02246 family)